MIRVQVSGGLGNQMFQFAMGFSIARSQNVPLSLDLTWFQANKKAKNFAVRDFDLSYADLSSVELDFPGRLTSKILSKRNYAIGRALAKLQGFSIFSEKDAFTYDQRIEEIRGKTLCMGNFQSERYFLPYRSELVSRLTRFASEDTPILQLRKSIEGSSSVAIHVRRGDYVSNPEAFKVHGVLANEYFQMAISELQQTQENLRFFVFSDDPKWVKKQPIWPKEVTFVEDRSYHPSVGINLMARCQHHILSNSTYGWWGAWLKDRKGRVIVPSQWLRNRHTRDTDLLVENWEILPT